MKKIVIEVNDMVSEKSRSKALKIAAVCQGVKSVSIEGKSMSQVAVTGDGIDAVCLTKHLRKKFRGATIVSVEDVKEKDKKEEEPKAYTYAYYPPPYPTYYAYDDPQAKGCFFF